jgi:hypothetical protein
MVKHWVKSQWCQQLKYKLSSRDKMNGQTFQKKVNGVNN